MCNYTVRVWALVQVDICMQRPSAHTLIGSDYDSRSTLKQQAVAACATSGHQEFAWTHGAPRNMVVGKHAVDT